MLHISLRLFSTCSKGEGQAQQLAHAVRDTAGKLLTKADEVHARLERAWQDEVFGERTSPSERCRNRFLLNMPQSAEGLEWLAQPPGIEVIDAVLSALRTDAATSTVPIEMFCSDKDFWAPHLTICIQRFFENDAEDPAHMLLVLVPKGGGDEHAALAQRPISISHALYRTTSKWQEQRLSKALNGCINKDQFGAQRGKSAEEALIMLRIAMEMAERSRQLGYQTHMLLLDWKKFFLTKSSGG